MSVMAAAAMGWESVRLRGAKNAIYAFI